MLTTVEPGGEAAGVSEASPVTAAGLRARGWAEPACFYPFSGVPYLKFSTWSGGDAAWAEVIFRTSGVLLDVYAGDDDAALHDPTWGQLDALLAVFGIPAPKEAP